MLGGGVTAGRFGAGVTGCDTAVGAVVPIGVGNRMTGGVICASPVAATTKIAVAISPAMNALGTGTSGLAGKRHV